MRCQQGRVLERGTHAELLSLGGKYAEMWAKQVRLYHMLDCSPCE